MKRSLFVLCWLLLLTLNGCGQTSRNPVAFRAEDGTIAFSHIEDGDCLTSVAGDTLVNLYRPDLFTLTVSVSGFAAEEETLRKNLSEYYGKNGRTVREADDSELSGYPCHRLSLEENGISEGAVLYLISPVTGYYYEIFYTVSETADEEILRHVHEILDSLQLA